MTFAKSDASPVPNLSTQRGRYPAAPSPGEAFDLAGVLF